MLDGLVIENLAQFHFLRPWWWLALIPALALFLMVRNRQGKSGNWHGIIRPEYLDILLDKPNIKSEKQRGLAPLGITLILFILGLMGPTWIKIPTPTLKPQDNLIILVDLSLSMFANDIKPSRIKRVQFKLMDLLAQRTTGLTSLVVYAGSAHTVVPLSTDTKTIKLMIPNLSPEIMPKYGSQPDIGMNEALSPLQNNLANTTLLWITDGIKNKDIKPIKNTLSEYQNQLGLIIYSVGTSAGTPIELPNQQLLRDRNNQVVIASLSMNEIKDLTQSLNSIKTKSIQLTSANTDIETISSWINESNVSLDHKFERIDQLYDQWLDLGPWLALIATLFFALSCRRGILL